MGSGGLVGQFVCQLKDQSPGIDIQYVGVGGRERQFMYKLRD